VCASCLSSRVPSGPLGRLDTLISPGTIFGEQTNILGAIDRVVNTGIL
jgi:hypothetical protein